VRVLCVDCVFAEPAFIGRGTDDEAPVLECHRFPPSLVATVDDERVTQVWPQMQEGDWCGEGVAG